MVRFLEHEEVYELRIAGSWDVLSTWSRAEEDAVKTYLAGYTRVVWMEQDPWCTPITGFYRKVVSHGE